MVSSTREFISKSFLKSVFSKEYETFKDSEEETKLFKKLRVWSERTDLGEVSSETPFKETFFQDLWGYVYSGTEDRPEYNLHDQYPVTGAGQRGGTGKADLAIAWFNRDGIPDTPQVLCEFKGITSNLDAEQNRAGNKRSPVKQALDYLAHSRRGLFGNESILPTWALVYSTRTVDFSSIFIKANNHFITINTNPSHRITPLY